MFSTFFNHIFLILVGECLVFLCKVAIFNHQVVDFRNLMSKNRLTCLLLFELSVFKSIDLKVVFTLYGSKSVGFSPRIHNFLFCMWDYWKLVGRNFDGINTFGSLIEIKLFLKWLQILGYLLLPSLERCCILYLLNNRLCLLNHSLSLLHHRLCLLYGRLCLLNHNVANRRWIWINHNICDRWRDWDSLYWNILSDKLWLRMQNVSLHILLIDYVYWVVDLMWSCGKDSSIKVLLIDNCNLILNWKGRFLNSYNYFLLNFFGFIVLA